MAGWIVVDFPGGANTVEPHAIHYCPTYGKWVIVGRKYSDSTGIAFESSDGLKWTQLVTGFEASGTFSGVSGTDAATTRGLVVILAGNKVIELDNLGTWTEVESPVGTHLTGHNPIAYLAGFGFCILGSSLGNHVVWISTDGVTWTGPSGGIDGNLDAQTVFKSRLGLDFIRIGNFGTFTISKSSNGTFWTDIDPAPSPTNGLADITFFTGGIPYSLFASAGTSKIIRGNTSLTIWEVLATLAADPGETTFIQLNYNSGIEKFIIISDDRTLISDDGETWKEVNHPLANLAIPRMYTATDTIVFAEEIILVMRGNETEPFPGYTEDPAITAPTNPEPEANNPSNNLEVTLTFDTNNLAAEQVEGYVITRTDSDGITEIAGSVLNDDLANTKTFIDIVPIPDTYIYTVIPYSPPNDTYGTPIDFPPLTVADIVIIGAGGIDTGGVAPTVFILNPSGIYTLVLDKRHDTLYERMPGITSNNVKIPDPFVKLGFIGSQNE